MNPRKIIRPLVFSLIILLLAIPTVPPLSVSATAAAPEPARLSLAEEEAAELLLAAPHAPNSLLVKLPAAAGSAAITAHSLRVWPQGVLSASLLLRAAEPGPALSPVYGVAADTAAADHYVVSPDVAAYSLPGAETGSEAGPEAGDWYVLQVEEGSVSRILAGLLADSAVLAA
ncbi:MAG: hypothetical protein LBL37_04880, partial [Gracilibacteraceae bacterium]|nr:hypothetical protein [Gracilibacteraceae bacterium]